jgi:hypothetical protein
VSVVLGAGCCSVMTAGRTVVGAAVSGAVRPVSEDVVTVPGAGAVTLSAEPPSGEGVLHCASGTRRCPLVVQCS